MAQTGHPFSSDSAGDTGYWEYSAENGFLSKKQWEISTWEQRQEQVQFDALCSRLQHREHSRRYRKRHPEPAGAPRARWRRWVALNPSKAEKAAKESTRARIERRSRARARRRKKGTCPICSKEWRSNRPKKVYCSPKCRAEARARRAGVKGKVLSTPPKVGSTHSPELIQEVRNLYQQGLTMREVGALLGKSAKTVWKIMHSNGIEARPSHRRGRGQKEIGMELEGKK